MVFGFFFFIICSLFFYFCLRINKNESSFNFIPNLLFYFSLKDNYHFTKKKQKNTKHKIDFYEFVLNYWGKLINDPKIKKKMKQKLYPLEYCWKECLFESWVMVVIDWIPRMFDKLRVELSIKSLEWKSNKIY